ncbi:hybrid sensor histidine kinase/response regulator [Novosphingobium sp. G106]|uniref:hybrid sensor histidine kinase/response regulator n=1 Tax=Novosphingobium sp. G106 TaxID=2849500 RepID=UPI001C2D5EF1|nr:hybrid sensor histidine kinase/response regulator [Novosphingobium sp. G106]MBV1689456.1 hybrid sensor histidine kinase/response regulator [Novosphingobium sp. G106]
MTRPLPPVHFLLVDDLEENLVSLEALLKRDELVILKARSGDEALELLLEHDVGLALLDVQMPGMDGFELAEFMRGSDRTRNIPIIFVTAGTSDARRRFRGYEAGAVDFIQKPIESDVLRSKANVFFDLCRQRQVVAAQRDELEAASRALVTADRRKDEFLATLAHELRNPLAAVKAGIRLLERREDAGQAAEIRDQMDRRIGYLTRLVDDLLDISRISEGKISLRKERVELRAIVQAAVEASQVDLDDANHAFSLDLPNEEVWLEVDPVRMAQVIANLLNNAAKYTPPGGNIALKVRADDGRVELCVQDDGVGIPLDMQTRIFKIFEQVSEHRSRAAGGLGIGLALVRQIVELHGGSIAVESAGERAGSAFTVKLPAVSPREITVTA